MGNKAIKLTYYISTGLLSLLALMSAGMYFFNNDEVSATFALLGFPTFIIYPLAIAKILGVVAIWVRKYKALKEWAYAGFFFDFLLAIGAHLSVSDGDQGGAIIALILLAISYFTQKKLG